MSEYELRQTTAAQGWVKRFVWYNNYVPVVLWTSQVLEGNSDE